MIRTIILVVFGLLIGWLNAAAQARIILNGAKVNITNGAVLVITNPAADAITRYDGHLISEGENNKLNWHIGTGTGNYTVPWGHGATAYLPLLFTKTAGDGNGLFSFATFRTGWHNSTETPQGVGSLVNAGSDYSHQAIDRFWYVDASGYNAKPDLTNLAFAYSDPEHAAPNTLTESALKAQRWNDVARAWNNWPTESTADGAANTVTVSAVAASNFSGWWTLASLPNALPVQWLSFTALVKGQDVLLNWSTAMEKSNNYFIVERSADGLSFSAIGTIAGAGNSNANMQYHYTDKKVAAGKWFYRLKQTDTNGAVQYSAVRNVLLSSFSSINVYPNPVAGKTFFITLQGLKPAPAMLYITDVKGNTIQQQAVPANTQTLQVQLLHRLPSGIYLIRLESNGIVLHEKLIVH